ncbi:MAG: TRAP transporter substrate-binding protein, partial [Hyphomicrobiales bacterium]
ERSKGEIRVDLFHNNKLGGSYEQVDQLRAGQIAMLWTGPNWFTGLIPQVDLANLPFSSADAKMAFCVMDTGLSGLLGPKFDEKNILVLGWGANGPRHVTNNRRPIKTLEDFKGLKIRVTPGDLNLATFRSVGAVPTPLDISELHQALQQGVVDGQENPYGNIAARRFNEVQKYLSNTGHFYSYVGFFMHKPTFENLSPEHKKIISEVMAETITDQRTAAGTENEASLKELIKRGMQYDEIPAAELAKFREATKPAYDIVRKKVGDGDMDAMMATIEKCAGK